MPSTSFRDEVTHKIKNQDGLIDQSTLENDQRHTLSPFFAIVLDHEDLIKEVWFVKIPICCNSQSYELL